MRNEKREELFSDLVLTSPEILRLYIAASIYDDDDYCPTMYGNLLMFIESMQEDWLCDLIDAYKTESDESFEQIIRKDLINYLKNIIQ